MKQHDIFIYDYIDSFWGISANTVRQEIEIAKANGADLIVVHISSGGGSVFEGYAIYNSLKTCGIEVKTIAEGLCASISSVIFMAGKTREMSPISQLMIHKPTCEINGDADEMRKQADLLDTIQSQIHNIYKTGSSLPDEELTAMIDAETWLNADQAVEHGFATSKTEAITNKKLMSIMNSKNKNAGAEILNKIKNLITTGKAVADIKNGTRNLEDGTPVYFEGDAIEVGTKLYADEAMTEMVADAAHRVDIDGTVWIITTVGGIVTELAEDTDDPQDALKKEIENLADQVASLTADNEAKDAYITEMVNTLSEVEKQVENFEKVHLGESKKTAQTSRIPAGPKGKSSDQGANPWANMATKINTKYSRK